MSGEISTQMIQWDDVTQARLRALWLAYYTNTKIADIFNCTPGAVAAQAWKMKLPYRERSDFARYKPIVELEIWPPNARPSQSPDPRPQQVAQPVAAPDRLPNSRNLPAIQDRRDTPQEDAGSGSSVTRSAPRKFESFLQYRVEGTDLCKCGRDWKHAGRCWARLGKDRPTEPRDKPKRIFLTLEERREKARVSSRDYQAKKRAAKAEEDKKNHQTTTRKLAAQVLPRGPVKITRNTRVWSDQENQAEIDRFIATKGVTKCPPPVVVVDLEKKGWDVRQAERRRIFLDQNRWKTFRQQTFARRVS